MRHYETRVYSSGFEFNMVRSSHRDYKRAWCVYNQETGEFVSFGYSSKADFDVMNIPSCYRNRDNVKMFVVDAVSIPKKSKLKSHVKNFAAAKKEIKSVSTPKAPEKVAPKAPKKVAKKAAPKKVVKNKRGPRVPKNPKNTVEMIQAFVSQADINKDADVYLAWVSSIIFGKSRPVLAFHWSDGNRAQYIGANMAHIMGALVPDPVFK